MFVITSREELREIFLQQISTLEPELAEELTDMIMIMKDEDIIPLVGDDHALQTLVQRMAASFVGRVRALDDEEVESDEEWVTDPFHSNATSWSPTAESTIQRAAIITRREDAYFNTLQGAGTFTPRITTNFGPQALPDRGADAFMPSSRITSNLPPLVMYGAQRQGNEEVPAETTGAPANSETVIEALAKDPTPEKIKAGVFVETTTDPAQSDTMKEAVAGPANLPERRAEAARDPLTSTSTISYLLRGANAETFALVGPAPQKKSDEEPRKTTRPRAPERAAADRSHPLAETEAPASMPLMEAVRQPRPPPRQASGFSRRARPANTRSQGQDEDDYECEYACIGGFLCGVCVMWCCMSTIC